MAATNGPFWTADKMRAYADACVQQALEHWAAVFGDHGSSARERFQKSGSVYDEGRRVAYEQSAAHLLAASRQSTPKEAPNV